MQKDNLKFVIVGHVDHGKSTLVGRLLYDTNSLSPDKIEDMKKYSASLGRKDEFSFLLDHLEEERNQGITIDTTQIFFSTPEREYVIIDSPGHVEFVKNMITGASQADAAILIVSGNEGVREQTRRHAYILSLLGISQIIVAINIWEDRSESAFADFQKIKKEAEEFLNQINIRPNYIVPIVAIKGDNIAKKSEYFSWYQGKTVLEALNTFKSFSNSGKKPLHFTVQDVYKINDKRINVGRVEAGILESDKEIIICPGKTKAKIKSIEKFQEFSTKADVGECAGFTTTEPVFIERGNVICPVDFYPEPATEFKASIFWMDKMSLYSKEPIILRCACQETKVKIEIKKIINSSTLETTTENVNQLENLEAAEVVIKTKKPLVITKFNHIEELGRFVLVREDNICAGGIIV